MRTVAKGKEEACTLIRRRIDPDASAVAGNGVGIAPGDAPRIFDRFYQADTARSGEGSGLGLSIAQWIVTNHNGRIDVSSRPNHGSVFRIVLPLMDHPSVRSESPSGVRV